MGMALHTSHRNQTSKLYWVIRESCWKYVRPHSNSPFAPWLCGNNPLYNLPHPQPIDNQPRILLEPHWYCLVRPQSAYIYDYHRPHHTVRCIYKVHLSPQWTPGGWHASIARKCASGDRNRSFSDRMSSCVFLTQIYNWGSSARNPQSSSSQPTADR